MPSIRCDMHAHHQLIYMLSIITDNRRKDKCHETWSW